jgi:hypothetical protein
MARVRKTQQGARMYFRGDSRRDSENHEKYARGDAIAFMEFCQECVERYDLSLGKLKIKIVGDCGLCGASDVLIYGRLSADHPAIVEAIHMINGEYHAE